MIAISPSSYIYKEEQLRMYVKRRSEGSSVWHLDATGSIIRSSASNKRILNSGDGRCQTWTCPSAYRRDDFE